MYKEIRIICVTLTFSVIILSVECKKVLSVSLFNSTHRSALWLASTFDFHCSEYNLPSDK